MKFTTHLELHSQTTRLVEGAIHGRSQRSQTGFSPSMTPRSRELRPQPHPKHPLQITTRAPDRKPDFKFELLPLHSPLLRQSLLVSFPPLIDMLKFSGYPYLIRGQLEWWIKNPVKKKGKNQPRPPERATKPHTLGHQVKVLPLPFRPVL